MLEYTISRTICKFISKPTLKVYALFTSARHTVPHFGSFNLRRSMNIQQTGNWVSQIYILNVIEYVSCNKSLLYRGAVFITPC
jgi:hypothetical protein